MADAAPARHLAEAQAQALAAELPPLLAEAEALAASLSMGEHGRRQSGDGADFWQFRRYQPGDPAAAIDWRQSARSQPLYVRETEWTASQPVWLWVDGSASMDWHSAPSLPRKKHRALLLALALAALLLKSGERVGVLGDAAPPASGRALLPRLTETLATACGPTLPEQELGRGGHLLLLSDFLPPHGDMAARLRHWAEAGIKGHLLQVLDPAEENLPYSGRLRFEGMKGEASFLTAKAEDLRGAYAARLENLRQNLRGMTQPLGWSFETHATDQLARDGALKLHHRLAGN